MKITIEEIDGWFDYTLDDNGVITRARRPSLRESIKAALDAYDTLKDQQAARKPRKTY